MPASPTLIASRIAPHKCVTTYSCVHADRIGSPGRSALEPLRIPADAFVVGTLANMRPVKRADLLLRAAIRCADLRDVYWLLIGRVRDPRVTLLARHPKIRDRVRVLGFRSDALDLMSGADLLVMPSRREGVARALLEAMSQGVCPIVSDAGGMREAVRHEVDGLVFPTGNLDALVEAIRSLYDDRKRTRAYAQSAARRVREVFSPERLSDRLVEFYRYALTNTDALGTA